MTGEGNWACHFLESRRTLWLTALVAAAIFALTNVPWNLDDYDQALQAYSSFEMVHAGKWFYQQTPQGKGAQKPPLVGWISAATYAVTRSWNLAWRFPCALAAAGAAIVIYRAAAQAYGAAPGLIALAAFALNLLSARLATLVRTDMPLGFLLFLPGLLIWEKIRRREPWTRRDRWWMFLLFAASMMIKGPMNFAFILPGVVLFQLLVARRTGTTAWCGWWPWLGSLGVIALWTICGILFVPAFYQVVFVREFLGRFGGSLHHSQPLLFYLPHLLQKFAPWSILLAIFAFLAARLRPGSVRGFLRSISPETLWLILWSAGGFILMSLLPSKRVDRIYPVFFPLCLLVAAQLADLLKVETIRRKICNWSAAALIFALVFSGAYSLGKCVAAYRDHADNLENFSDQVNAEVAAHQWKIAVLPGRGGGYQGMLLYLQLPHFTPPEDAVAEWNSGAVNALVIPKEKLEPLLPQLPGAIVAPFHTVERPSVPNIGYYFVTRGPAPEPQ